MFFVKCSSTSWRHDGLEIITNSAARSGWVPPCELQSDSFNLAADLPCYKCGTWVYQSQYLFPSAIYNFNGKGAHRLRLQLGETVQILEENSGKWPFTRRYAFHFLFLILMAFCCVRVHLLIDLAVYRCTVHLLAFWSYDTHWAKALCCLTLLRVVMNLFDRIGQNLAICPQACKNSRLSSLFLLDKHVHQAVNANICIKVTSTFQTNKAQNSHHPVMPKSMPLIVVIRFALPNERVYYRTTYTLSYILPKHLYWIISATCTIQSQT